MINDTMYLSTQPQMHYAVMHDTQVITALTQLHFSKARSRRYHSAIHTVIE